MSQLRLARTVLLMAAIGLTSVAHAQALRPEIGKPLQQAQELMKAKKYKEALNKLHEVDAVGNKNANENYTIERMRGSIAQMAGDNLTAARSFEAVLQSGKVSGADQLRMIQAIGTNYYSAHDYSKAASWFARYVKEGGTDPAIRNLLTQTYYQSGDFSRVASETKAAVQAEEKAGQRPSEEQLQLLANSSDKIKDKATYLYAMEKLVAYYPKKDYWADLLNRLQNKPGYSDRLSLDVFRLKFLLGQVTSTQDYLELSQLALQGGFPAEAIKVIEQGFKSGALGTGAAAERHQALRKLANTKLAEAQQNAAQLEKDANENKDGTALINLGYSLVTMGQNDKGLALINAGLKKGDFKRAEDAKLHAGLGMLQAGRKPQAVQTLRSVQGTDGTAEIARYWILNATVPDTPGHTLQKGQASQEVLAFLFPARSADN